MEDSYKMMRQAMASSREESHRLALAAVQQDGLALKEALMSDHHMALQCADLLRDDDIVLAAVQQNGLALQ
eukprot:5230153-Amphidinium_carterae.3